MSSTLAPLLDLPDVRPALEAARAAVDVALADRVLRRRGGAVAAEAGLRSAVASAALEGHVYDVGAVRAGTVTDPVLQGCLRVSLALDGLVPRWSTAPRQVLARLHVLAARGSGVDDGSLGRPTGLGVGGLARLDALCDLVVNSVGNAEASGSARELAAVSSTARELAAVSSTARELAVPALLRAAVVHGELLALGAFAGPNGVVARAAARLTLIADGLDPRGVLPFDVAHLERQPEYVGCANAFATGTPDGLRAWLRHCAAAAELAAATLPELAQVIVDDPPPRRG